MGQSTLEGVISLTRLINRATTPDRSATIKEAQTRLETAQKQFRTAKSPERASERAEAAQDAVAIAEEQLLKAQSARDAAAEKLTQAQTSQKSADEMQLLADAVTTANDRVARAQRKVDRLQESVRLIEARQKSALKIQDEAALQSIQTELDTEQKKLSNASIQLRLRQSELKEAESALSQAQKESKTPEEIQVLAARLNELEGKCDRAVAKLETAKSSYQTAQQEAQATSEEYLKLEAALLAAETEFDAISQATAAEERFQKIERALGKVDDLSEMQRDIKSAIGLLPEAEFWWNSVCLGATVLTALIYFTPLSKVLQNVAKTVQWSADAVVATKNAVDSTWAPDLQGTPKTGETIASWTVTSEYGRRGAPCAGCSSYHGGVDLADPRGPKYTMGRELYAVGQRGTKVEVTCWNDGGGGGLVATLKPRSMPGRIIEYLHLSKCLTKNGESQVVDAGVVIARVGDSGIGTGAHLHLQEKDAQGTKLPPRRGIAWWALTGEEPQPIVSQRKTN